VAEEVCMLRVNAPVKPLTRANLLQIEELIRSSSKTMFISNNVD